MPVYELTVSYEADNDQSAMSTAIRVERDLTGFTPGRITVERLARIVVTRMPGDKSADDVLGAAPGE